MVNICVECEIAYFPGSNVTMTLRNFKMRRKIVQNLCKSSIDNYNKNKNNNNNVGDMM